ncbi:unnamed protein product [Discula destructiva]
MRAPARPGTAAKRNTAPRAPKSLVKVLEDDSQKWKASRARPVDVLARMRSATPAAIPGLKREASEPLGLNRIPHGDKYLQEKSRNVLCRSTSSTSTVDLKAQKKAEEARQIEEAISGIRKPNRSLVGKAIIEDAEKRTKSSSSPHPKKQRNPVRNAAAAAANRVQVKATPANYRFRDAVSGGARSSNAPLPRTTLETIPSSSSVIPNTAPRKSFRDDLRDGLAAFHIASTPAAAHKATAQAATLLTKDNCIPESSPIMARKTVPAPPTSRDYLTVSGVAGDLAPSSPILPRIFETPVKRRMTNMPSTFDDENIRSTPPEPPSKLVFVTPVKKISAPTSAPVAGLENNYNTASRDLYQHMGWEDDFDALF